MIEKPLDLCNQMYLLFWSFKNKHNKSTVKRDISGMCNETPIFFFSSVTEHHVTMADRMLLLNCLETATRKIKLLVLVKIVSVTLMLVKFKVVSWRLVSSTWLQQD